MARNKGLSDEEREALRALQQGGPAPIAEDPVWDYLVSAGLVTIDRDAHPHRLRLTDEGRAHPTAD
jgi:hypothetical protein